MKYHVETIVNGSWKAVASFEKRSSAIEYAQDHDVVQVRRKTDYTNRIVFSRRVSKANGFVTITETETFRAK